MVLVSKAEMARARRAIKKAKAKENASFIRKMSGKPRLPSITTLKNKLWELNTAIVRRRDGPICVACKTVEGYAQNHIIPQCEAPGMAYDLDNIFWGLSWL